MSDQELRPAAERTHVGTDDIVRAGLVAVGEHLGEFARTASARLDGSPLGPISHVTAAAAPQIALAQPHQLWLVDDPQLITQLRLLGATAEHVTNDLDAWISIARWQASTRSRSDAALLELTREVTVLRRELNRALSALGREHQVLSLMPSVTVDQLRAERRPSVGLQPDDPNALMARRWHTPAGREMRELEQQAEELRRQLEALQQTRVMRWTRVPRRWYARLRRG